MFCRKPSPEVWGFSLRKQSSQRRREQRAVRRFDADDFPVIHVRYAVGKTEDARVVSHHDHRPIRLDDLVQVTTPGGPEIAVSRTGSGPPARCNASNAASSLRRPTNAPAGGGGGVGGGFGCAGAGCGARAVPGIGAGMVTAVESRMFPPDRPGCPHSSPICRRA